jgi:16S rRNA (guanine527-N7)-methyltransferase
MCELDINYVKHIFSFVTDEQLEKLNALIPLYKEWNQKINVISRKDIDNVFVHHILYSLAIGCVCPFNERSKILDVGTGGGFPGIPLSILFPKASFHLIDGIGKKIKVVNAIVEELNLKNVVAQQIRCEDIIGKYDFVVSRAVTALPEFYHLVRKHIAITSNHYLKNGILYLTGGDMQKEMENFKYYYKVYDVNKLFYHSYFETKKLVYIPVYKK